MTKRLLQIGAALNCGAPGKIAEQIGLLAMSKGWDVYMAHGVRHSNPSLLKTIPMVTPWQEKVHALYSLLFDGHGLGSSKGTKRLVDWIEENKPDIIHLHNIHGYFLNYKVLFEYLIKTNIPIVWTLHDCWPFTGHCAYFDSVDCKKWQNGCNHCPLHHDYPMSLFLDRASRNYQLKKRLFAGLERCTIVPVSDWLGRIVEKSFLNNYPIHVIHNGVDIDTFKPISTNMKNRLNISNNKIVVLGVAAPWLPRKGYMDMIQLSKCDNIQVVMVGVSQKQQQELPSNIISFMRTSNQNELAELYSMADVFVNPTYSDNFPTTNVESLACGTPVITYKTGGSPEAIDDQTGSVVEQGNIEQMIETIYHLRKYPLSSSDCRKRAEDNFNKDKCFEKYINLYESLL